MPIKHVKLIKTNGHRNMEIPVHLKHASSHKTFKVDKK